jgi:hypothetical protein
MVDDRSNIKGPTSQQGAPRSSRATLSFQEYCLLDEALRKKMGRVNPIWTIIPHVDALTKKVGRDANPRNRALA